MERIVTVKDDYIRMRVPQFDGQRVIVTVERVPRQRSLAANRYYFGALVRAISDYTGMTKEEVHEYLKFRFNPKEIPDPRTGEFIVIGGTTTTMKAHEFSEFIIKTQEVCDQLGIERIGIDDYWESIEK